MEQKNTIKVIGVAGSGVNAINHMIDSGLKGIGFIAVDTDTKTFYNSKAQFNIKIGKGLNNISYDSADTWAGYLIALNEISEIVSILEGSDMIFILAGMGKLMDIEVSSLIAKISRMVGALTVAIVTWPGSSEKEGIDQAEKGINKLLKVTDTVIPLPMDRIEKLLQKDSGKKEKFNKVCEVIYQSVRGITDLILSRNLVGLDILDVKTILSMAGGAAVGFGQAKGKKRSVNAAKMAVSHPFMEHISIADAKSILLNLTASDNVSLEEITNGSSYIYDEANDPKDILWGVPIDNSLNDFIKATVIATGIDVSYYVQGKRPKEIKDG